MSLCGSFQGRVRSQACHRATTDSSSDSWKGRINIGGDASTAPTPPLPRRGREADDTGYHSRMLGKPRILVVEDESGIADTIQYVLATDGFTPVWCSTAEQALKEFRKELP